MISNRSALAGAGFAKEGQKVRRSATAKGTARESAPHHLFRLLHYKPCPVARQATPMIEKDSPRCRCCPLSPSDDREGLTPMPLLPLEPYLFPSEIFDPFAADGNAGEDDAAKRWIVLHCRPRAEKSLARQLLARQVPFFLPLFQKQWRSNGRLQSSYLPLFPGHVFL